MKYLLDTDHLSILQRKSGKDYQNLSRRMADYLLSDFTVSTITFHEQILGCHSFINRARNLNDVVKGYEMMTRLINDFKTHIPQVDSRKEIIHLYYFFAL
jgi:tRNA(fMet)-specific endonuclease VapC